MYKDLKDLSLREVYSQIIEEIVKNDKNVYVLEADLSSSMSTNNLKNSIGKNYINLGIMEANMIGVASGISIAGGFSFSHTFAQFMTRRAFDQIFISLAYSKQNACLIGSDAGISAEFNGGTHMPFEDISLMNSIPNAKIYEVLNGYQFKYALYDAYENKGLTYIRTIRKNNYNLYDENYDFSKGLGIFEDKIEDKKDKVLILASGIMVYEALKVKEILNKEKIEVTVVDIFRIKPLNEELILKISNDYDKIIVCENHSINGGLNSIISLLFANNIPKKIKSIAVNNFGQVGTMDYLKKVYHLTCDDIIKAYYEF